MFRHTLSQASQTDEKNLHVPEVIPHPVAQKSRDLRIGIGATAWSDPPRFQKPDDLHLWIQIHSGFCLLLNSYVNGLV